MAYAGDLKSRQVFSQRHAPKRSTAKIPEITARFLLATAHESAAMGIDSQNQPTPLPTPESHRRIMVPANWGAKRDSASTGALRAQTIFFKISIPIADRGPSLA
jgi:hypothetical protein